MVKAPFRIWHAKDGSGRSQVMVLAITVKPLLHPKPGHRWHRAQYVMDAFVGEVIINRCNWLSLRTLMDADCQIRARIKFKRNKLGNELRRALISGDDELVQKLHEELKKLDARWTRL